MLRNLNLRFSAGYTVLAAAVIASWFPVFSVSFLNDDYQILGYQLNKDFPDLFEAFIKPGVYYHYWRPIPDFIHGITLYFAGFNPLPFRIIGLLIYCFACIQVFRSLKILELSERTSLLTAVFFAVLPSHILEAAWIADQLESLVASFLLLSFINYIKAYKYSNGREERKPVHKYLVFSGLWFAAAVMTKEISFTGILIPAVYLIYKNSFGKNFLLRAGKDIFFGFLILFIIFLYRITVVGGTPFTSGHFDNVSIPGLVKNFFIYIPLAFSPPELLEFIYADSNLLLILAFLLSFSLLYFIFRLFRKLTVTNKYLVFAGAAWFIIFIIPALPALMRWYVFTASAGLIWIAAVFIEESGNKKFFYFGYAAVIVIACYLNIESGFHWIETGSKMNKALESSSILKKEIISDTLYVWCTPDKYKRVPMMKLGIQQSLEWSLLNSFNRGVEVFSPLRAELIDAESKIILEEKSDSTLMFHIYKGRFLEEGGESRYVIKKEKLLYSTGGMQVRINTFNNKEGIPESIAMVKFLKVLEGDHLYYNGAEFILLEKKQ